MMTFVHLAILSVTILALAQLNPGVRINSAGTAVVVEASSTEVLLTKGFQAEGDGHEGFPWHLGNRPIPHYTNNHTDRAPDEALCPPCLSERRASCPSSRTAGKKFTLA